MGLAVLVYKRLMRTESDWETSQGADKLLARHTSRCILFDGENISFDASLVIYKYVYIYVYICI